jgi:allantoinase
MSDQLDLVVQGGFIVTPEGVQRADLGVAEGRIVKIAPEIRDSAAVTMAVGGRYVFPGIIDSHVHFHAPGPVEREGLATGSAALAAGGGTVFFDLPLNSEPPVLDAAALREKRARAEERSCLDFALWGGLTARNLDQLAGLRDAGAIGLKAVMGAGGAERFPRVDAAVLREGMKRAARLGLMVAVHAEDETRAAAFPAEQKAKGRAGARAWLDSWPVEVELAAMRTAIELAGETGCALHVVNVSSPEGVALIDEARLQRVDVTAGTGPHYLLLNEKDVARIGTAAKCAPPIRDEKRRVALWRELRAGRIQMIGSDHAPAPAEQTAAEDFFAAQTGLAGCQHGFELLFSACATTREKDLPVLAAVLAQNIARRFRLDARKGLLAEGRDADFSVVEFGREKEIESGDLWTRHRSSAYVGRHSQARVSHTYVRGGAVYADGRLTNLPQRAQFLTPYR